MVYRDTSHLSAYGAEAGPPLCIPGSYSGLRSESSSIAQRRRIPLSPSISLKL